MVKLIAATAAAIGLLPGVACAQAHVKAVPLQRPDVKLRPVPHSTGVFRNVTEYCGALEANIVDLGQRDPALRKRAVQKLPSIEKQREAVKELREVRALRADRELEWQRLGCAWILYPAQARQDRL